MTSLGDVEDVEGYARHIVAKTLGRHGYRLPPDEIREAEAEAVVLLFELYEVWDGNLSPFGPYASRYLPKRLISWWRVQLRQSGRGSYGSRRGYRYRTLIPYETYLREQEPT